LFFNIKNGNNGIGTYQNRFIAIFFAIANLYLKLWQDTQCSSSTFHEETKIEVVIERVGG
jgi:hypothetical protein